MGIHPEIVISEDEVVAPPAGDPAERIGNPLDAFVEVDQIAGDRHEVGIRLVRQANEMVKIRLTDAAREMEIGEVQHREAFQVGGQAFQLQRPLGEVQLQALVAGHAGEKMVLALAGGGFEVDKVGAVVTQHLRGPFGQIAVGRSQQGEDRDEPAHHDVERGRTEKPTGPTRQDRLEPMVSQHEAICQRDDDRGQDPEVAHDFDAAPREAEAMEAVRHAGPEQYVSCHGEQD